MTWFWSYVKVEWNVDIKSLFERHGSVGWPLPQSRRDAGHDPNTKVTSRFSLHLLVIIVIRNKREANENNKDNKHNNAARRRRDVAVTLVNRSSPKDSWFVGRDTADIKASLIIQFTNVMQQT